jgi:hypothetical protein
VPEGGGQFVSLDGNQRKAVGLVSNRHVSSRVLATFHFREQNSRQYRCGVPIEAVGDL